MSDPERFSDGFELRSGEEPAQPLSPELVEPLDRAARETSQGFERDLDATRNPGAPNTDDDMPASPPLDLLAGPREDGRSRRENLPLGETETDLATPAASASEASGRQATPSARAARSTAEPDLFRPVGPIRSSSLDDPALGGRLNTGIRGLRRGFPLSANDPFAPVGVRTGRFLLYPGLEQSVGVSDNLTNSIDGAGGAFSQTTLSARAISDWSRHEAEINAAATYRRNFAGPVSEEPRIAIDSRLRLDLSRDWTTTFRGALDYSRDDPIVTGVSVPADAQADVLNYSGSAEVERRIAKFGLAITGEAVREDREDNIATELGFLSNDSFTTYTSGIRGSYELSPAFRPFVAASVGRRIFDRVDAESRERDSVIPALRAGLGFDFGEKLSGEVALGYAWNRPDDSGFETDGSPTVDARINWSPRRGTDVLLEAATYFEPDATGFATSTLYQTSLGVRHRATARLELDARLSAAYRDSSVDTGGRLWSVCSE